MRPPANFFAATPMITIKWDQNGLLIKLILIKRVELSEMDTCLSIWSERKANTVM